MRERLEPPNIKLQILFFGLVALGTSYSQFGHKTSLVIFVKLIILREYNGKKIE